MKTRPILLAVAAVVLCAGAAPHAQSLRGHELLGVRAGGVISTGAFNRAFGDGSEIDIHFIHGFTPRFGLTMSLSSHNFGESLDQEKNLAFFNRTDVNLQVFSVTAGAILAEPLGGRFGGTLEGGFGLYSANAILPFGFLEAQKTDNHFGLYTGAGLLYRIANTVYLNANGKFHYMFIGGGLDDTVFFYTGEHQVPFYQIAIGVVIATGR